MDCRASMDKPCVDAGEYSSSRNGALIGQLLKPTMLERGKGCTGKLSAGARVNSIR